MKNSSDGERSGTDGFGIPNERRKSDMKKQRIRRTACTLMIAMLAMIFLPHACRAEGAEESTFFASFEELQQLCAEALETPGRNLVCTSREVIDISEDLTIPPETMVTFWRFGVPEGVTFTVSESAMLMTVTMRVEGELTNYGMVIQEESLDPEVEPEFEVVASIPGHVTNRGTMSLINVLGKRNITRWGGSLTMSETARFHDIVRNGYTTETIETVETAPPETPAASPSQTSVPAVQEEGSPAERVFEVLEDYLPSLAFFIVLYVMFRESRKKKPAQSGQRTAAAQKARPAARNLRREAPAAAVNAAGEDHFERDKRNRIAQLDEWLCNGLIGRKEYRILKQRYEQESGNR